MGVTSISWTDITVNPVLARDADGKLGYHCRKVSPGCLQCYAETFNKRRLPARGTGLPYVRRSGDAVEVVLHQPALEQMAKLRRPTKIFWCSMTDLFGGFVPAGIQQAVLDAAAKAADAGHVSQILTKRPASAVAAAREWALRHEQKLPRGVWLGFSAEDQRRFDERWRAMRGIRAFAAGFLWVSYEPALGPVDMLDALGGRESAPSLGWIVIGGESGPGARPFELAWARSAIRQAQAAGAAPYMKQAGTLWARRRRYLGRTIYSLGDAKGENPKWWPLDLRVREFPGDAIGGSLSHAAGGAANIPGGAEIASGAPA